MDVFDLTWWRCVDGYEAFTPEPRFMGAAARFAAKHRPRPAIRSRSERFESYEPLKLPSSALFRRLVDTPSTASGMVAFANSFGLLRQAGERTSIPTRPTFESVMVPDLLREQAGLRRAVVLADRGESAALVRVFNRDIALVRQELRLGDDGRIYRVFVPASLLQALWLQFAAHVESGAKLIRCATCSDWFRVGTGTDRRDTARFCSNRCRQAAYLKRKEA